MFATNQTYSAYFYYFVGVAKMRQNIDPHAYPITRDEHLAISIDMIVGMTLDDLRLFDDPNQAEFPTEYNGGKLLAQVTCWENDKNLFCNIKDFQEIFPNLESDFKNSVDEFNNEVNDSIERHNNNNKSRSYNERYSWWKVERISKLFVPKIDVTTYTNKKINVFLDPDIITV